MAELIFTFKAGMCEYDKDSGSSTVTPISTPGYVYITREEDYMHHVCWRPRSAPVDKPELDLLMFPGDASFQPYAKDDESKIGGRICVLKFSSSSQRHLFWLQSPSRVKDPSTFSAKDRKITEIVNTILSGEIIDVNQKLQDFKREGDDEGSDDDDDDDDDDTAMEDADVGAGEILRRAVSGGAGADATGGDVREEGSQSREGGADGGRA